MTGTVWLDDHVVAGHVALDFCNTVYRRTPELGAELLDSTDAFYRWLIHVDLVAPTAEPVKAATLRAAVDLRSVLWKAFDAQRAGRGIDPAVLARVLAQARRGAEHVVVDPYGAITASATAGAPAALAVASLQLLLHPPTPAIRACDGCGWFFVDTSRSRRRRWCSMRTCGNEHKVARYRAARGER
ncbi:CGNR zinc finger domain-containing protein [Pseudactinotalea suaedae]|uniref:CGNR zinc finger domain-containing protein n=1 Tax=Pseudactinotalea suaedae TaxID=1524924 RepID=UPI0012E23B98|nr:CGNR zinc finger domain-containing protein [Pseudactinotalea suaedae]